MRFPPLHDVVKTYVRAILDKDASTAVIASGALGRVAAQKSSTNGGLTEAALEHIAALERGDKKGTRDSFVSLGSLVGIRVEVTDELRLVEREGP